MSRTLIFSLSFILLACSNFSIDVRGLDNPSAQTMGIEQRLGMYATYEVTDPRVANLSEQKKELLRQLIEAAQVIDTLYLEQLHPQNVTQWLPALRSLAKEGKDWENYLRYFQIAYGPWDVFMGDWYLPKDRFPEVPPLPGKNVYPLDLYVPKSDEKERNRLKVAEKKLSQWLEAHPKDETTFRSPYTIIRRNAQTNDLVAVPYAEAYHARLVRAKHYLAKALPLATDPALKKMIEGRLDAFRTNRFDENEPTWLAAHDTDIQLTIGPYEEYADGIWGAKRFFGARVALKDQEATGQLQHYRSLLGQFQENLNKLSLPRMYLGDQRRDSFITVVNEIFMSGDARHGVQTLAHKLPNDRNITTKFGSRRVLFQNVLKGKCEKILKPIAKIVMAEAWSPFVSCDSFTKGTLHHELSHALGPAFYYPVNREKVEQMSEKERRAARKQFGELLGRYGSPVEEAKADILGLYNRQFMFQEGLEKPREKEKEMYATYVAGFFRTVRFGAGSAHRKGVMMQFNRLHELGAITFGKKGKVQFVLEKMPAAIEEVVKMVLSLQVGGDAAMAENTLEKYGSIPKAMQKLLDQVQAADIPRDLYPEFPALEVLGMQEG